MSKKKKTWEFKEVDKIEAKLNSNSKVYTMDLQSVLPPPCGEVANFYSARKYDVHFV